MSYTEPKRDPQEIRARLLAIAELLEHHESAICFLKDEQLTLRNELRATGWVPPELVPKK